MKTIKGETGRHNTEGRITRVIERANDTFVCTYEMLKDGGEAVPIDEKVDMVIEIPEGQEMEATTGARVIVEVTEWPGKWTDAKGHVTEVIGYEGDKGLDIDIIIAQHRLPHVFSDELMKEADALPREVVPENGVADFRIFLSLPSTDQIPRTLMMRYTVSARKTVILNWAFILPTYPGT